MKEVLIPFLAADRIAVHAFPWGRIEVESFKTRKFETPGILCRNGVDSNAEQRMRHGLQQLYDFVTHADYVSEIFRIAHARESRFFIIRTQAGKIIPFISE